MTSSASSIRVFFVETPASAKTQVRKLLEAASGIEVIEGEISDLSSLRPSVAGNDQAGSPLIFVSMLADEFYAQTVFSALSRPDDTATSSPLDCLTKRQLEVLGLLAEGNSNKQIAARLRVSVKTIEAHRASIIARLGIPNLAGLVRLAVREGLVG